MEQEDLFEKEDFRRCADFHGHICPGLAIGYQAAKAALAALKESRAVDEEVVTTVETDACGTDAVQVLTGCTLGKGNLLRKDHGKHVYTIVSRKSGEGVRVALKGGAFDVTDRHRELIQKIQAGTATEEDRKAFQALHHEKCRELLAKDPGDLFDIRRIATPPPPKAVIEPSVPCALCGEPTMRSKLVERNDRLLCRECAGA
jgi:formylmethanofuran dehydrogenase subunit E